MIGIDEDRHLITKIPAGSIDAEANARLIAAAPDLLAACEEVEAMHSWLRLFYNDVMNTAPEYVERCGDWGAVQYMMIDCDGIADQVRAALAKARGA